MSEMVERVAQTLREIDFTVGHPNYYQAARAVIEAMREPTKEMTAKACMTWPGHPSWEEAKKEWRDQIDIALSNGE